MTAEYYVPESGNDVFRQLQDAALLLPDHAAAYGALRRAFHRCLEEQTQTARAILGGTFAKTDYLLKTTDAPQRLVHRIHATRVRLHGLHEMDRGAMERFFLTDLRHVALFVAHVCGLSVPASLARHFTAEEREAGDRAPHRLLLADSMRVIVESADDHYIYVQADGATDGEPVRIDYAAPNRLYPYDWTYLRPLLTPGAQLNIVRPRAADGAILPELIIYEPDYLVDVTAVARCFENYAESSLVNLVKKLQHAEQTEAIVLGNLAGFLLDETIHEQLPGRSYEDCVRDFFRANAISLLTANATQQLHDDARRQFDHIRRAMHEVLPADVPDFDLSRGIVEPSFFSEMLGLQGRMDYLQQDFRVLIEQKSGKGAFPYDKFNIPRQTEQHYVQMLLYMLIIRYNYREQYERNGFSLYAYLLYSKYSESLLNLSFAPELVFRALKIRNGIAARELRLTEPSAYRFLERLQPEALNLKGVCNKLWQNWQQPQLAELLRPLQTATPLERAYCERLLSFVSTEHVLSKLGNKTKEGSGFSSIWHNTLEEKRLAGNIYDDLTLLSPDARTAGPIESVVLGFSETAACDMSNFRVGDIVILYPYDRGTVPDARRTPVMRCTIADLRETTITLRLRAPQTDNRIFSHEEGRAWAIEHDFMESSYSGLYHGVLSFLSATPRRRDLLMLQREPEADTALTLRGDYDSFNELALRVKQARDFFLIIGPPGTGKTSFGMLNTVREELLEPDGAVLLLSYTNRAVDEMCSKLHAEGIDFLRIGNGLSCSADYRDKLLSERAAKAHSLSELQQLLCTTRVVVAMTTAMTANIGLLTLRRFTLAVIDEASQILEPHLLALLSAHAEGGSAIRKFVMIGDYKQLPAVVQQSPEQSHVDEPLLRDILLTDCRNSLFERLLRRYGERPDVAYMLTRQGRMHPDIADFPNRAFYGGRLKVVPREHQKGILPLEGRGHNGIEDLLLTRRIAFLAVTPPRHTPGEKVNQAEADVIAATVVKIYEMERDRFDVNDTVGVIVPYRNQIATVRNTLDRTGIEALHDITIDTVERFQGSQRRYIIYGFTVQRYHQLQFLTNNVFTDVDGSIVDRKLNVAMTRAEEHLIMTGWPELLCRIGTFRRLIDFVRHREGYFEVSPDAYCRGAFTVSPRTARSLADFDAR